MKKLLTIIILLIMATVGVTAQNTINNRPDAIVGIYSGIQGHDHFRAKVTRSSDGTYRAQIVWLEHDRDDKGRKILDRKNPDKSLRNNPADRIVLFSGLKHNAKEHCWDGTKIYDPQRGIRAKMTARFDADGRLHIKGSLMGISETVIWTREE